MINLAELCAGDQVTIRDGHGNVAVGTVRDDRPSRARYVEAFGVRIDVARLSRENKWLPTARVWVIGHTPALFGLGTSG